MLSAKQTHHGKEVNVLLDTDAEMNTKVNGVIQSQMLVTAGTSFVTNHSTENHNIKISTINGGVLETSVTIFKEGTPDRVLKFLINQETGDTIIHINGLDKLEMNVETGDTIDIG